MEDEYQKWRNLIGDYMLAFAEVEGELNTLLSDILSVDEYSNVIQKQFKPRLCKAKEVLPTKVTDRNLIERVNKLLDRLLNYAENERNLIAHNPLELSLDSIFEDVTYFEIRGQRITNKYITFEKLEQKYYELRQCISDFEDAYYHVAKHL